MRVYFHRDPYEILREFREVYPTAVMDDLTWKKPEGVEILAQVQIRTGDPYFWIYLPRAQEP